ncbi:DUF4145 domain-containing protein [Methylosinus sp. Ce-a6]|uniref:DUF4145 domain-containing protein n=1 Tax=Methylosinus sp. Ce-a6 TaxID=2172005 RepID=UPI001356EAAD|nr:DUF4145 domain-containing protein [Methylosinus sp. Ce-a6]
MAIFQPNNPNFFQPEGNLQQLQIKPAPITIRCPHCRQLGTFSVFGSAAIEYSKNGQIEHRPAMQICSASIRICPNAECFGFVFVVLANGRVVEIEPPELIDFNSENLPLPILATLREAISCHAAGAHRAAAMMVRRLLEEICDLNSAQGSNLHQKLVSLKTTIVLPEALFEAMMELKALGNDAAHIEAKAYDNIGSEEAADSIELAKEILKALYQLQSLLSRLQARKPPSASPS